MLGVKMFSRKSGLVPGFSTILKCTPECDGIMALHTDGKALQEEICFALISGDRLNATSQLREKLCILSIYRPKSFKGNGDRHMGCRQQCIFGSLANSSLLSCRTCRKRPIQALVPLCSDAEKILLSQNVRRILAFLLELGCLNCLFSDNFSYLTV